MPAESIDGLKRQWQRLVADHFNARRDAAEDGASQEELDIIDLVYGIRIDVAFSEMKIAESLEVLHRRIQPRVWRTGFS